jgi:thiamine pyrophosphate-dependent acetolactate synthase large subunit-like protein
LKSIKNTQIEVIALMQKASKVNEEDFSKEEILTDVRQAWHEAMTGQTIPVSQLWEEIKDA